MRLSISGFLRTVFGLLAFATPIFHSYLLGASETVLWSFGNGSDGHSPSAGLLMDKSGNLYGTTYYGGSYNGGTVFELTPPSTGGRDWTESILWNFGNGSDGQYPVYGPLIVDENGNLYGTTYAGGAYHCSNNGAVLGCGTIFELKPPSTSGGSWTESILWSFGSGADGQEPDSGLIMDESGNLYGTTYNGGAYGGPSHPSGGILFELTPPSAGGGHWAESILWNFGGNLTDGIDPGGGLIMDPSGNLYGTTYEGGAYDTSHLEVGGTAFELSPPTIRGGNWNESILWNFGNGADGKSLSAGLLMDKSGNLYGTTNSGGPYDGGIAYELSPPSNRGENWNESILWSFGTGTDGVLPLIGLIMDASGNLYGVTGSGGTDRSCQNPSTTGCGTVFKLTTVSGNWNESILWNFGNGTDGRYPAGRLMMDSTGNLYGTTEFGGAHDNLSGGGSQHAGTVFEISKVASPAAKTPKPKLTEGSITRFITNNSLQSATALDLAAGQSDTQRLITTPVSALNSSGLRVSSFDVLTWMSVAALGLAVIVGTLIHALVAWRRAPAARRALLRSIALSALGASFLAAAITYHLVSQHRSDLQRNSPEAVLTYNLASQQKSTSSNAAALTQNLASQRKSDLGTSSSGAAPIYRFVLQPKSDLCKSSGISGGPCANGGNDSGGLCAGGRGYFGGPCKGDVRFDSSATLISSVEASGSVTINTGTVLCTNGYSIVADGTFANNGTVYTGWASNGGSSVGAAVPGNSGGSYASSYGGGGGGGGGGGIGGEDNPAPGGAGGTTAGSTGGVGGAVGDADGSNGGNGVAAGPPSALSESLISGWYSGDIQNYLSGGGGASGGGGGSWAPPVPSTGSGGAGACGLYIQAHSIAAGNINAYANNGSEGGGGCGSGDGHNGGGAGGGGGGGGGSLLFAYSDSDGYAKGAYNLKGGSGGAGGKDQTVGRCGPPNFNGGNGGDGGKGQVLIYRYSTPPVPPP